MNLSQIAQAIQSRLLHTSGDVVVEEAGAYVTGTVRGHTGTYAATTVLQRNGYVFVEVAPAVYGKPASTLIPDALLNPEMVDEMLSALITELFRVNRWS